MEKINGFMVFGLLFMVYSSAESPVAEKEEVQSFNPNSTGVQRH
jgi:hypothetical protein